MDESLPDDLMECQECCPLDDHDESQQHGQASDPGDLDAEEADAAKGMPVPVKPSR